MFHGSVVALITPFFANGEINFDDLAKLIELHVESGTHAIVVIGTTGEAATLTSEEQYKIIEFSVKEIKGRLPIIAGTFANSTEQVIANTKVAMQLGVDACLIMSPAYIKPTQEGLFLHYSHIAENVAIPIILYNVPGRTTCDMSVETVARLAEISNIVAIKEASGDTARAVEIMRICGDKITVLSGEDSIALPVMLLGGKGVISVTANIAPRLMSEMCNAALTGDIAKAIAINNKLIPLHRSLFLEANPIPVKWCAHELKMIASHYLRLPLTSLSSPFHDKLREAIKLAELI